LKPQTRARGEHPQADALALYASGDVPWSVRWRIKRHVSNCASCAQQVESVRAAKAELKREAETQTLTGFEAIADWSRLEREMIGNIAVGVAAARCVDHVGRGRTILLRAALVFALAALVIVGWITHLPREQTENLVGSFQRWAGLEKAGIVSGVVLGSSPRGVVVRAQGSTLTMMHPRSAVISVSGSSAVEARYVDEETGQVTITSVYAQ
jgi:hypothetical protein